MWGNGELRTTGAARAIEERALQPCADLLPPLAAAGLRQERRALRVRAGHLNWTWLDAASLQLEFELPSGCYATSVVHELGPTRSADATNGTVAAHDEE
jgi:tRNA pseudouridine13 synthase